MKGRPVSTPAAAESTPLDEAELEAGRDRGQSLSRVPFATRRARFESGTFSSISDSLALRAEPPPPPPVAVSASPNTGRLSSSSAAAAAAAAVAVTSSAVSHSVTSAHRHSAGSTGRSSTGSASSTASPVVVPVRTSTLSALEELIRSGGDLPPVAPVAANSHGARGTAAAVAAAAAVTTTATSAPTVPRSGRQSGVLLSSARAQRASLESASTLEERTQPRPLSPPPPPPPPPRNPPPLRSPTPPVPPPVLAPSTSFSSSSSLARAVGLKASASTTGSPTTTNAAGSRATPAAAAVAASSVADESAALRKHWATFQSDASATAAAAAAGGDSRSSHALSSASSASFASTSSFTSSSKAPSRSASPPRVASRVASAGGAALPSTRAAQIPAVQRAASSSSALFAAPSAATGTSTPPHVGSPARGSPAPRTHARSITSSITSSSSSSLSAPRQLAPSKSSNSAASAAAAAAVAAVAAAAAANADANDAAALRAADLEMDVSLVGSPSSMSWAPPVAEQPRASRSPVHSLSPPRAHGDAFGSRSHASSVSSLLSSMSIADSIDGGDRSRASSPSSPGWNLSVTDPSGADTASPARERRVFNETVTAHEASGGVLCKIKATLFVHRKAPINTWEECGRGMVLFLRDSALAGAASDTLDAGASASGRGDSPSGRIWICFARRSAPGDYLLRHPIYHRYALRVLEGTPLSWLWGARDYSRPGQKSSGTFLLQFTRQQRHDQFRNQFDLARELDATLTRAVASFSAEHTARARSPPSSPPPPAVRAPVVASVGGGVGIAPPTSGADVNAAVTTAPAPEHLRLSVVTNTASGNNSSSSSISSSSSASAAGAPPSPRSPLSPRSSSSSSSTSARRATSPSAFATELNKHLPAAVGGVVGASSAGLSPLRRTQSLLDLPAVLEPASADSDEAPATIAGAPKDPMVAVSVAQDAAAVVRPSPRASSPAPTVVAESAPVAISQSAADSTIPRVAPMARASSGAAVPSANASASKTRDRRHHSVVSPGGVAGADLARTPTLGLSDFAVLAHFPNEESVPPTRYVRRDSYAPPLAGDSSEAHALCATVDEIARVEAIVLEQLITSLAFENSLLEELAQTKENHARGAIDPHTSVTEALRIAEGFTDINETLRKEVAASEVALLRTSSATLLFRGELEPRFDLTLLADPPASLDEPPMSAKRLFKVIKVNRLHRNTPRVFEIDSEARTLTVLKQRDNDPPDVFSNRDMVISIANNGAVGMVPVSSKALMLDFYVADQGADSGTGAAGGGSGSGSSGASGSGSSGGSSGGAGAGSSGGGGGGGGSGGSGGGGVSSPTSSGAGSFGGGPLPQAGTLSVTATGAGVSTAPSGNGGLSPGGRTLRARSTAPAGAISLDLGAPVALFSAGGGAGGFSSTVSFLSSGSGSTGSTNRAPISSPSGVTSPTSGGGRRDSIIGALTGAATAAAGGASAGAGAGASDTSSAPPARGEHKKWQVQFASTEEREAFMRLVASRPLVWKLQRSSSIGSLERDGKVRSSVASNASAATLSSLPPSSEEDFYEPKPNPIPREVDALVQRLPIEALARRLHHTWSQSRFTDGWRWGLEYDESQRTHPCMVPYERLSEASVAHYTSAVRETLGVLLALNFTIAPSEHDVAAASHLGAASAASSASASARAATIALAIGLGLPKSQPALPPPLLSVDRDGITTAGATAGTAANAVTSPEEWLRLVVAAVHPDSGRRLTPLEMQRLIEFIATQRHEKWAANVLRKIPKVSAEEAALLLPFERLDEARRAERCSVVALVLATLEEWGWAVVRE